MILAAAAAFLCGPSMPARADKENPVSVAAAKQPVSHSVTLIKGMAKVVDVTGPVGDIMVANPAIVDVSALQSNKLYMVGLAYGTTNVMALDSGGNVIGNYNVTVNIDVGAIQGTVSRLFPKEDIKVTSASSQIILTGSVSTPEISQQVASLVASYTGEVVGRQGTPDSLIVNLLKVAGQQQVMLRVRVVEASRDVLRELGLEFNAGPETPQGKTTLGLNTAVGSGLTSDPLGTAAVLFNSRSNSIGPIQMIVRALEQRGLLNTLAEPNLTAISGEEAGFLAGGEFPIPMSRDQNNNIVVTYKPFGVALNFKPLVLSDDRISLQLQTEVSAISNQNSLSSNGITVPGFTVRRAATTVEMGSGGTLMIAGLLQSNEADSFRQLPGIGDIPVLGALMSSRSFSRNESELLVIVTAFIVNPYDDPKNLTEKPEAAKPTIDPLAKAFEKNIRGIYNKRPLPSDLFAGGSGYGYLLR